MLLILCVINYIIAYVHINSHKHNLNACNSSHWMCYTPKQATPSWGKSMSLLFLVIETRSPTPNRCHRRICIPCYRLNVTCLFIKDIAYKQKSVEPVLLPVPRSEGPRIAQSVWNEHRWKPHTDPYINIRPAGHSPQSKLMYTNITWSVSRCFVFDGF